MRIKFKLILALSWYNVFIMSKCPEKYSNPNLIAALEKMGKELSPEEKLKLVKARLELLAQAKKASEIYRASKPPSLSTCPSSPPETKETSEAVPSPA